MRENFYIGGGTGETLINPIAAVLLALCILGVLCFPRRFAIFAFLLGAMIIPSGNVVVLAGVHLVPVRCIALVGALRLSWSRFNSRAPLFAHGADTLDNAVLGWALAHTVAFIILWRGTDAVINQCGFLLGSLGIYFLFRHLIRDQEDVKAAIKALAIIAAINATEMIYEQYTDHNLFSLIGSSVSITSIREAHVRAQGAFRHTLLAGSFGGITFPLFASLWVLGKNRVLAIVGMLSSVVMALCTWSSTPLFVLCGAIGGILMWPLRHNMRRVRWGILLALLVIQLFMRAPVWFLIQRVELGGTSGYHRAILVDNFVRHFWDWWLIGTKDMSTWDYETWDTSNEYVAQGEVGGLLTFIFFIATISRGFGKAGRARKAVEEDKKKEWYYWLLGVAMFANCLAFFGVSYWDQTQVAWFAFLAIVSAATFSARRNAKAKPRTSGDSSDSCGWNESRVLETSNI